VADLYANFAYAKLSAGISATDTVLTVDDTSRFPSAANLAAGEFWATIEDPLTTGAFEIVRITGKTSNSLTVVRAQEGTAGVIHPTGVYIKSTLSAAVLRRARAAFVFTTATMPTTPVSAVLYVPGDFFFNETTGIVSVVKSDYTLQALGASVEGFQFSWIGTLAVAQGVTRIYLEQAYTFVSCRASLGLAPTGASAIVDVNKNGTTIYTTQTARPTIVDGGFTAVGNSPAVTSFAQGDYITVDIDQIGSTTAGSHLVVQLRLRAG
jgi:hypothetical protein